MSAVVLPPKTKRPETWLLSGQRLVSRTSLNASLVNIYPLSAALHHRVVLGTTPVLLGRAECCDIHIPEAAVSRRHARLQPRTDGSHEIIDLDSTNGTFVNDKSVLRTILRDGDYLRIGTAVFRYLAGGNVEADYHAAVHRLVSSDSLTDTYNRRYFLDALERATARAARFGQWLSLVLVDVDCFKEVNDNFGHLTGDRVLRELASRLRKALHRDDLLARYGGEEFAAILAEAGADQARMTAERLRRRVEAVPFDCDGRPRHLTISVGVTSFLGSDVLNGTELIRRVDANLYQAKESGRNCVVGS